MGSAPCPQVRRYRYSGSRARLCRFALRRTQSEGRKLFGSPQAPYLRWCVFGSCPSPEVYMGSAPCPQDRRCRYSGECPNPNQKDASCLGVPKPHISDGVYLGVAQAPRCIWGAPHAPKTDAAAIRENARTPIRRTQAVWESPSPISPMVCIWEMPKPRGVYGERPMPPRQDAAAIRGAEPNFTFSLFTFHFSSHSP